MSAAVLARDLRRTYDSSPPVHALRGVDLRVDHGERLAVVGASGSGKSTLLNLVGLLDVATGGDLAVLGEDVREMTSRARDRARARLLGFVFQESHVLGHRTVTENLEIRAAVTDLSRDDRSGAMHAVLESVGLLHRRHALARLLSGGERQRLAVARAVLNRPRLLLADEPTGNLDQRNAEQVLALFDDQARRGVAVVVITHDDRLARWADRVVHLVDGRLHADGVTSGADARA